MTLCISVFASNTACSSPVYSSRSVSVASVFVASVFVASVFVASVFVASVFVASVFVAKRRRKVASHEVAGAVPIGFIRPSGTVETPYGDLALDRMDRTE